ncbi:MAG: radical SAM protein, partial [Pseudomonadota bacterium]
EGYDALSLSGGEPMLYPDLAALLDRARGLGFRLAAITNGYRIGPRFRYLIERFDGLAVSFDGLEPVHDRVRGAKGAYRRGMAALDYLAEIDKPAAAAFTVSRESLADAPEFVEIAASKGVRAVQLRPLVLAGRARTDYADPALSQADMARLWLMTEALSEAYRGRLAVHADLAHASGVAADRRAWASAIAGGERPLSDLVNPLVITPEGRLRPFTYDFPSRYDLGRVEALTGCGRGPLLRATPGLSAMLEAAFDDVARRDEFVDWFAFCRDFAADFRPQMLAG